MSRSSKASRRRKQRLYGHPNYQAARHEAMARSNGVCQFCGNAPATQAHHWAPHEAIPSSKNVTAADLTCLCEFCHETAHVVRRYAVQRVVDHHNQPIEQQHDESPVEEMRLH